ncbi:MAG: hypothetical protein JNN01_11075 [Opitutaceae bacterium]|nr:hypothetical protein [Opitutaceae bacterium]
MHPAHVFIRSDQHPPVTEANQEMGPAANRAAWAARESDWTRGLGPALNGWRERLNLRPVAEAQDHALHSGQLLLACEQMLAGNPCFAVPGVKVTGAWYLDQGTLPPEIEGFCRMGESPLFVGFGSMRFRSADELSDLMIEAATMAEVRCVIGAGWSEMPVGLVNSN